jgi:hypothetical protein
VRVAAVVRDLIFWSRIFEAGSRAGAELIRVDSPADLPPPDQLDLVLVDWGARSSDWGEQIIAWVGSGAAPPRVILFGPHTDLDAHAAAKSLGLGPMVARSQLPTTLVRAIEGGRA